MTTPTETAAATIAAAGFTPCAASAFTTDDGRAFAFSVEFAGRTSITGPAFSAVVTADGTVTTTGTPKA